MKLAHVHMNQFEQVSPYVDTLVLPIGTIEAHGPHAPLGTDILIPNRLADSLERRLSGRIWTAPEIAYGHCWHLQGWAGTIDVPQRIFADYVHAVVSSFAKWGIKNVVLLNGHGGNNGGLNEVANRLVDEGLSVLLSNYWVDYQQDIAKIAPGVGHAGEDETSLILAVDPQNVDLKLVGPAMNEKAPRHRAPGLGQTLYPQAYSGDPQAATREKGEQLLAVIEERLVQDILAMWNRNS